ncbi:MAG: hypothetical protein D6776_05650 [Planctomycetota bacterium]|nr:MAG: hypothetical protein D6776_05650 [Planctomycetota bacterium]
MAALVLAGALPLAWLGCNTDLRCHGSSGKTSINTRVGRYGHLQLTLPNGKVWVIGGIVRTHCGDDVEVSSSAELYDPALGRFLGRWHNAWFGRAFFAGAVSDAGTPGDPSDDYVLIAGGVERLTDEQRPWLHVRDSVVRIALDGPNGDPQTVEHVGNLPGTRFDLAAVALPDGRVAFIGGRNSNNAGQDSIQIWSPDGRSVDRSPGDFTGPVRERYNHRAIYVPNLRAGWILVTGGRSSRNLQSEATAIDLQDDTTYALSGFVARQYHSLTLLDAGTPSDPSDDAIVEIGGLSMLEEDIVAFQEGHIDTASAVRLLDNGPGFAPSVQLLATNVPLGAPVFFHTAAASDDGLRLLAMGGFTSLYYDEDGFYTGSFIDSDPVRLVARLTWDPVSGLLAVSTGQLQRERAMAASSRLADGTVFVTGGINDDLNSVRGAELLTP